MVDYKLVAIHSVLEDYRLAYFINQKLQILLEKDAADIGIKISEGETCFSRFIFDDAESEIQWNLLQNKNRVVSRQQEMSSLFEEDGMNISTNVYLLPEFSKVDYILKVENIDDDFAIDELVDDLLDIKHIATAYTIDQKKLKSKNNLIF